MDFNRIIRGQKVAPSPGSPCLVAEGALVWGVWDPFRLSLPAVSAWLCWALQATFLTICLTSKLGPTGGWGGVVGGECVAESSMSLRCLKATWIHLSNNTWFDTWFAWHILNSPSLGSCSEQVKTLPRGVGSPACMGKGRSCAGGLQV